MRQYLLTTYVVEGEVQGAPATPEEMQTFMERVMALEAEMDASGTFVFGGAPGLRPGPSARPAVSTHRRRLDVEHGTPMNVTALTDSGAAPWSLAQERLTNPEPARAYWLATVLAPGWGRSTAACWPTV